MAQACSEPDLQSSAAQWGSYFALTSAAVHWCCITVQLYEEQISLGVIAVAQACSEPALQSSAAQWESYFALTSAAVHWCCITVQLYEEQVSTGVIAVAQACSEPDLQSSTALWESYFAMTSAAMHWCCITVQLYEEQVNFGAIHTCSMCWRLSARQVVIEPTEPMSLLLVYCFIERNMQNTYSFMKARWQTGVLSGFWHVSCL